MFNLNQHLNALRTALHFLTVIPVGRIDSQDKGAAGLSVLYYPVVGVLLGFLLAVFAWFVQTVLSIYSLQLLLLAALVLGLWVVLTGALHVDGLADSGDGWLGGWGSKSRTLELMADPASTPKGVSVVGLVLLIKFSALVVLLGNASLWLLLIAPFIARLGVLALIMTTPSVAQNEDNLSKRLPRPASSIVLAVAISLFVVVNITTAIPVLIAAGATLLILRWMMMARLSGCTGHTLGATIELLEAAVLVVLVALL